MANERIKFADGVEDVHSIDHVVSARLQRESDEDTSDVKPESDEVVDKSELQTDEDNHEEGDELDTQTLEEDDDDQTDDDPDSNEDDEDEVELFTVTINGEEKQVSLEEALSGYQRQEDYTRKTQEVAETKKEAQERSAELNAQHEQFVQRAKMLDEVLNRDLRPYMGINWEQLQMENPSEYAVKLQEVQNLKAQKQALAQHVQQADLVQQQNQALATQEYVKAEYGKILNQFPEWKVEEKRQEHQAQLVEYGKTVGYTESDLNSLIRAEDLLVLDKARKWDELQKSKQSIQDKEKPVERRTVKGKAKKASGAFTEEQKHVDALFARARKSGNIRHMAEARSAKDALNAKRNARKRKS